MNIRPSDFIAIHLSAFADYLALAITDIGLGGIMSVTQQCINEIVRRAVGNFQRLSPGTCEGILFSRASKDLKLIGHPAGRVLCRGVDLSMKRRLKLLGFGSARY